MGADLYLKSVHDAQREAWEWKFHEAVKKRDKYPEHDKRHIKYHHEVIKAYEQMYSGGYFNDRYNPYGLFAQLGISWWKDVCPMLDADGYLPIHEARLLAQHVALARLDLSEAEACAREYGQTPPSIVDYEKQRHKLLTLLDQSIALGEPLYCSL